MIQTALKSGFAMKTVFFCVILILSMDTWGRDLKSPSLPGRNLDAVSQDGIKPLTTICESCHGQGGRSTRDDVPAIAGKKADFIMDSLEQFYFFERHCPDVRFENYDSEMETKNMCDVTNALTNPEGLALAKYFENQESAPVP